MHEHLVQNVPDLAVCALESLDELARQHLSGDEMLDQEVHEAIQIMLARIYRFKHVLLEHQMTISNQRP